MVLVKVTEDTSSKPHYEYAWFDSDQVKDMEAVGWKVVPPEKWSNNRGLWIHEPEPNMEYKFWVETPPLGENWIPVPRHNGDRWRSMGGGYLFKRERKVT